MHILISYFSSLFERIIFLLILCLFLFFLFVPFAYSVRTLFTLTFQISLLAFSWLLVFQQVYFCSIGFKLAYFLRLHGIFISSIVATLLLMLVFPATHFHQYLEIDTVRPQVVLNTEHLFSNTNGTLLLNLEQYPVQHRFFALSNTKALWIDSNNLLFQDISTNGTLLTLSKACSFDNLGYYPQKGSLNISLSKTPFTLPKITLSERLYQYWLHTIFQFHNSLDQLYTYYQIPISSKKLVNLNISKPKPSFIKNFDSATQFSQTNSTISLPQPPTKISVYHRIINYLKIFLSIWIIFLIATLFGLAISIHQHVLGEISLMILFTLFAIPHLPSLFTFFTIIQQKFPYIPIILLQFIIAIGLGILCILISTIKSFLQEKSHG